MPTPDEITVDDLEVIDEIAAERPTCGSSAKAIGDKVVFWAARIKESMGKSLAATLETGTLLIEAKAALSHGEWLPLLKKLSLHPRSVQLWMSVARNPRFANAKLDSFLPPHVKTLDAISRLPEEVYGQMIEDGEINPTASHTAIVAKLRKLKQNADEERVKNLVPVQGKFCTIVIDPPWSHGGGRKMPYAIMDQRQLLDLPVPDWLEDKGHVYLCATNAHLRNGFSLFDHWGIAHCETLVWNKTYPNGEPRFGMGQNFRHTCEFILFGVRGNLHTREAARSIGTSFTAPVIGEHSTKPDAFYEIIRAASYPPFGELFGRKPREGFTNLYEEAAPEIRKAAA